MYCWRIRAAFVINSRDIHIFTDLDGSLISHDDYKAEVALPIIAD